MYTALPAIEKAKDSVIAKTIGTFIMGAGTALAYTNAAAKAEDIREKFFDLYKKGGIPHAAFSRQISLEDLMGTLALNIGVLTACYMEAVGMEYTYTKFSEGQTAPGLVYPAAKVVTHGLAWLVDKYSKR